MTETRQTFRVLLIDDAPAVHPTVEAALQDVCEVRAVDNGEAGIQTARQWRPDVIICDMLMPGLNGYETIQQLKMSEEVRDVPIILLSGVADESNSFPGIKDLVACVISKPFEVGWLRANVAALLPGGGRISSAARANPQE